jgi:hypothetical protein
VAKTSCFWDHKQIVTEKRNKLQTLAKSSGESSAKFFPLVRNSLGVVKIIRDMKTCGLLSIFINCTGAVIIKL